MAGKKITIDGRIFDSHLEGEHYKLLKSRGIKILQFQPQYVLYEGFEYFNIETNKLAKYSKTIYTPDFLIQINENDKPIVLEVKGVQTPVYMLRKKLFVMKYKDEYNFFQSNKLKDLEKLLDKYKSNEGGNI